MTTQVRTTVLTALFIFGLLTGLQAQDKYEYAVVAYSAWSGNVSVSLNGTSFKKIPATKEESQDNFNANPALKQVNILSEDGWEVFNTQSYISSTLSPVFVFYLRRKVE